MQQRLGRHLLAQLVTLGEHNITGLLATCGRQDLDWSSDYRMYSRRRIDPARLFDQVRRCLFEQLPGNEPVLIAIDDTHIRKSGRKVAGGKYARDPMGPRFRVNFIWAQRFLQMSMGCGSPGQSRMIPVGFQHAPVPRKPSRKASDAERNLYRQAGRQQSLGRQAVRQLEDMRGWLDQQGQPERPLWCVVDGGYTNRAVLKNLPSNTVLVGRIRSDAKLHWLARAPAAATGRKRVYGEVAPTPEQLRQDESIPWQQIPVFIGGAPRQIRVKSLGPLRWRVAGQNHILKLVVVAPLLYRISPSGKYLYRRPAYLISTDPDANSAEIVQRYIARWDIEVNFRDEKTLLGVGEAQVRDPHSVDNVTATAVAAYALLLAAASSPGPAQPAFAVPPPKWQNRKPRRATTQRLIQQMRFELWGHAMRFSHFASPSPPTPSPQNSLHNPSHAVFSCSRHS